MAIRSPLRSARSCPPAIPETIAISESRKVPVDIKLEVFASVEVFNTPVAVFKSAISPSLSVTKPRQEHYKIKNLIKREEFYQEI